MSKVDKLQAFAANIQSSIGVRPQATGPAFSARTTPARDIGVERSRDAMEIEVERIIPDAAQPRKDFEPDALGRLAESLRTRGQLQPIVVRWVAEAERYVILTGERRWRAAQIAGVSKLRCVVRADDADASERLVDQMVENCLREDLNPMEQARAYRELMDAKGWTVRQLAEELAISPGRVSQTTSLLKLPDAVAEQIEHGDLTPTAAYELSKLDDPAAQIRLATAAVEQGLTRSDVVQQLNKGPSRKKKPAARKLPPAIVWRLNGYRVEVSRKAGVETREAIAALRDALARLESSLDEASAA